MEKAILDLFKVMVITEDQKNSELNMNLVDRGIVLDFDPTVSQMAMLKNTFQPLQLKTLFTVADIENSSTELLMAKQILHYIEVYGLGMPGLFNLEIDGGKIVTVNYVKGVTRSELGDMVRALIYRNAPIADVPTLAKIIAEYDVHFNLAKVANNEVKMMLFSDARDRFDDGDDAVRYICYKATGSSMLIKSRQVIDAVSVSSAVSVKFLEDHKEVLAQVFNRHKKIIMSLKSPKTRTVINQITRLSKTKHVPIKQHISKTFVALALENQDFDFGVLSKVTVRDMFKYLNLLAYKKLQTSVDSFVIRNGKIHIEEDRKTSGLADIDRVEKAILAYLSTYFAGLKDKVILLDSAVDYGLPVSRKQAVGQLPYGTEVTVNGKMSSGIYWENAWGARDLDLSTIDLTGNRVGWGGRGFTGGDIMFSGDVTSAPSGAMEFMTSETSTYGLFTNIYSGESGSKAEIVCGTGGKDRWIDNVIIREKVTLNSRGMVTGFVKGNKFIVYLGRLNDRAANFGERNPILKRATCDQWTVKKLFDAIGIQYVVDKPEQVNYDLTYKGFSYDKLEELLLSE
jgi:hypothetical protein